MKDATQLAAEITAFTKSGGPLTKRIRLAADGSITSDGSECVMARGVARRVPIGDVKEFAALLDNINPNQAIALGALRPDLPGEVGVVTKHNLNGHARPDVIARTGSDILYRKGQPAFALLDFDTKGLSPDVAKQLDATGGFWPALVAVLPDLHSTAHVIRRSTSAGLSRTDTGEQLPGSNGQHGFVAVQDGTDIERFLKTLHARCWLAGFGWMMVGVAGHLLERSIIDRSVGGPERLVFEGAPILDPPLMQDAESRKPSATDGDVLDTIAACPPLTVVEKQAFAKLRAEASQQLQTESNTAREAFIARQTQRLMARRTDLSQDAAKRVIERQCRGVLLPDVELPFSDRELAGVTVADVLADPARFDGCVLADPIEGVEYGRTTAIIMRRRDGTPWIHSFAHGRTTYELKFDARSIRLAINQSSDPVETFIKHALAGDLNKVEEKQLLDDVALRAGVGVRIVTAELKSARWQREQELSQERRSRRLAERTDPRPQILNPAIDAPWLPIAQTLDSVLGVSPAAKPPTRNIDSVVTQARKLAVPNTHAFTNSNAAEEE
jgi:hypothetical protein